MEWYGGGGGGGGRERGQNNINIQQINRKQLWEPIPELNCLNTGDRVGLVRILVGL